MTGGKAVVPTGTQEPVFGPSAGRTGQQTPEGVSTATRAETAPSQTLVLEGFPQPSTARALSPNGRVHWGVRDKARKHVAAVVAGAGIAQRLEPTSGPVRLTFRWIFPTRARRDLDNLSTGVVKVVIDSLVRQYVLVDDDSTHVVAVTAEAVYEKGRRALVIVMEGVA